MSKIQEQIKALQLKQKKIEYLSYLADLIKNDTKCVDFKDVQEEIVAKIEPVLLDLMTSIELDSPLKKESKLEFTEQEIVTLKAVADKILNKPTQPQVPQAPQNSPYSKEEPQTQTQQKKQELSNNDKMAFALNNRHLANKKVQVLNDQNAQIFGSVVGLDAPFVVVKTETGPTIQVPLEKVVPV